MAKFYGPIGFCLQAETAPSVWTDVNVERAYYGDVIRNMKQTEKGIDLNDNISLSNLISIIADDYAMENYLAIRYITWLGVSWKVKTVDIQRPRLILTLGGVYNGS